MDNIYVLDDMMMSDAVNGLKIIPVNNEMSKMVIVETNKVLATIKKKKNKSYVSRKYVYLPINLLEKFMRRFPNNKNSLNYYEKLPEILIDMESDNVYDLLESLYVQQPTLVICGNLLEIYDNISLSIKRLDLVSEVDIENILEFSKDCLRQSKYKTLEPVLKLGNKFKYGEEIIKFLKDYKHLLA